MTGNSTWIIRLVLATFTFLMLQSLTSGIWGRYWIWMKQAENYQAVHIFMDSLTSHVAPTSDLGFSFPFLNASYLLANNLSWYYLLHTTESLGAGPFSRVCPVLRWEVKSSRTGLQSIREWGPRAEYKILTQTRASRQPLWDLSISPSVQEVQMSTCSWLFAWSYLHLWHPTHTAGYVVPQGLRVAISTAKAA